MEAFLELRQRAREKRDKIIAQARDEYASTLIRIARARLAGRDSSTHRSVASCINSVLPSDRPFSAVDVLASLEALDPGRVWRKARHRLAYLAAARTRRGPATEQGQRQRAGLIRSRRRPGGSATSRLWK